ncbi:hypothetical protein TrVE_jg9699 [Triparma verrucosa]|uniref:very-long-chain (3R)-3-hydroxyacyl-CoA dehydratase n=1 Tax=Triparma verrucosa TaxID=1606542 RepID=A0A9W7FCG8_9STRA|nr:hypothetical protein TrVE_jg9699 [Triparma verrucosa]
MGAITTTLNWTALIGWTVVAVMTVFLHLSGDDTPSGELMKITLFCELICASETLKIAAGLLRGDLALSFTVHYTRLLMYFVTMPHSEVSTTVVKMILLAWSLTEMFRYPMVLFPEVPLLRTIRYATPLITFPLGAGTEAYAAYKVLMVTENMLLKPVLGLVVLINVGGGTLWYPGMIHKVIRSVSGKKKAK